MTWSQWRSDLRERYYADTGKSIFEMPEVADFPADVVLNGYYAYHVLDHTVYGHSQKWRKGHHNDAWQRLVRLRHFTFAWEQYQDESDWGDGLTIHQFGRMMALQPVIDRLMGISVVRTVKMIGAR